MSFQWNDSFRVGIEEIDSDHQRILEKLYINMMNAHDEIEKLITFVEVSLNLAKEHFKLEEEVLRINAYPDLDQYSKEHQDILEKFEVLLKSYKDSGSLQPEYSINYIKALWLGHLNKEVKEFREFFGYL